MVNGYTLLLNHVCDTLGYRHNTTQLHIMVH